MVAGLKFKERLSVGCFWVLVVFFFNKGGFCVFSLFLVFRSGSLARSWSVLPSRCLRAFRSVRVCFLPAVLPFSGCFPAVFLSFAFWRLGWGRLSFCRCPCFFFMLTMPVSFSLSCVGLVGSRGRLPLVSLQCARGVLSSFSPSVAAAGGSFASGCCPSGLDRAVRSFCLLSSFPLRVFSVSGVRSAAALRARSLRLVASVSALFVFPLSASFAHSGSWLCAFAGARRAVPVFVFLPSASLSSLPCVGGVVSWRVVPGASVSPALSAFSFFAPVVDSAELSLL